MIGRRAQHDGKIQVTRILRGRLKTLQNLVLRQTRAAQFRFDLLSNHASCARELPRDGRFVLVQQPTGLCKRQVLGVVAAQSQTVSSRQAVDGIQQRTLDECQPACSIEVRRRRRRRRFRRFVGEGLETFPGSHAIHVPLREHRAEPGRQTASPVIIGEERAPLPAALGQAEQVRVQRVCQIAGTPAGLERIRGPIKGWPIFANELLPRVLVTVSARAGQREILEVQRAQMTFHCRAIRGLSGERPLDARLQRLGKSLDRDAPARAARLSEQALNQIVVKAHESHRRSGIRYTTIVAHTGVRAFESIFTGKPIQQVFW